ncbi:hypothetical protein M9458_037678, partial [Cirrhinus mrigala]
EIRKMDRKMRKLLMIHAVYHPKADTNRLTRDAVVAMGLLNFIAIVSLSKYIERGSDKLMKMVRKHKVSKTKYSLMKTTNEIRKHYGLPRQEDHPKSTKIVER